MYSRGLKRMTAARSIAMSFGILGGIGAMIHGVGEILQGSVKPEGIFIPSWTQGPIALYFDGDPAITIVPNLLYTGILAVIISTIMILWSGACLNRKHGGLVLVLLAVGALLFGGGGGPPILALIAGLSGLGINAKYTWWRKHLSNRTRHILAAAWPYVFFVCLANGLFLVVGHVVAAYYFAPVDGDIFLNSFLLSTPLLLISIFTGIFYDIENKPT